MTFCPEMKRPVRGVESLWPTLSVPVLISWIAILPKIPKRQSKHFAEWVRLKMQKEKVVRFY